MVFAATGTAVGVVVGVIIVVVAGGGPGVGVGVGGATTAAGRPHHETGQAGVAERVYFGLENGRTLHVGVVRRGRLGLHRSRAGHLRGGRTLRHRRLRRLLLPLPAGHDRRRRSRRQRRLQTLRRAQVSGRGGHYAGTPVTPIARLIVRGQGNLAKDLLIAVRIRAARRRNYLLLLVMMMTEQRAMQQGGAQETVLLGGLRRRPSRNGELREDRNRRRVLAMRIVLGTHNLVAQVLIVRLALLDAAAAADDGHPVASGSIQSVIRFGFLVERQRHGHRVTRGTATPRGAGRVLRKWKPSIAARLPLGLLLIRRASGTLVQETGEL